MLLDGAKELFGFEFVFAGGGTAQQARVQYDDVAPAGLYAIENTPEVIQRMNVADRNENIAWTRADRLGSEFALLL